MDWSPLRESLEFNGGGKEGRVPISVNVLPPSLETEIPLKLLGLAGSTSPKPTTMLFPQRAVETPPAPPSMVLETFTKPVDCAETLAAQNTATTANTPVVQIFRFIRMGSLCGWKRLDSFEVGG